MEVTSKELFEALEIIRSRRANEAQSSSTNEVCDECGCVHNEPEEEMTQENVLDIINKDIDSLASKKGITINTTDTGEAAIDLLKKSPTAYKIFENFLAANGIPYSK